jgi:hypothetical protein
MMVVGPIFIGALHICACSFFKGPNRRNFNAIMIAGAVAAYLTFSSLEQSIKAGT